MLDAFPNLAKLIGQRDRIEGLGDHFRRAHRQVTLDLIRHGLRRHEHDGRARERRNLPQAMKGLNTVHTGHHHVEENDVGAERRRFLDRLHSTFAKIDREPAELSERELYDRTDIRLVLDITNALQGGWHRRSQGKALDPRLEDLPACRDPSASTKTQDGGLVVMNG